jgi:hypothetical protein
MKIISLDSHLKVFSYGYNFVLVLVLVGLCHCHWVRVDMRLDMVGNLACIPSRGNHALSFPAPHCMHAHGSSRHKKNLLGPV